jgi:hypothetical protein
MWLLGCVTLVGCGIGTDAKLRAVSDAAAEGQSDARSAQADADTDASSALPEGPPPIDRTRYDATAMATFALG